MKVQHLIINAKDYKKLSYSKLRKIEQERILLEIGSLPLANRLEITKNIKKIMQEMSWF